MLFNSLSFLFVFLPLVVFVAMRLRGAPLLGWICLSSCVFYASIGQAWFLLPMVFTVLLDFTLAPMIARAEGRKRTALLLVSVICNLGLLCYFKYARWMIHTMEVVSGASAPSWVGTLFDVMLPAGISFYTFQTLSYILDVYNGIAEPERNISRFTAFVSFFPHLVAGPITRHDQLIPELEKIARRGVKPRWQAGIFLFVVGLCKKVLIADRIGLLVDPILSSTGSISAVSSWLALLGFAMQVYFDFSGYSDMAIGLGRLFDVELPQNFNSPYQSRNPVDYWQRWHISLGTWIRDYVFNPLALAARRRSPKLVAPALLVTMFLVGIWHGAGWTFAAFGLYHGALMLLYVSCRKRWNAWPTALQRSLTFFLVCFGDIFFRSHGFGMVKQWALGLFGQHGLGGLDAAQLQLAGFVALGLAIVQFAPNASSFEGFERLEARYQIFLGALTAAALLLMNYSSQFIYFQF